MKIQDYLAEHGVAYELLVHPETFGAQRMAAAVHVPGHAVSKTVLLYLDHGYRRALAVVPATHRVDFSRVSAMLGNAFVEAVTKPHLIENCPDCEPGAIPPFGNRYGMLTLVDESLSQCEYITFEGNTHHESIRMKWADFVNLEHPLVGHFAVPCQP
jgi:Ala-tRNA(Pro) deacylase